ncbi:MAG: hypothetical protein WCJ06_19135 [Planctomycetota bacterium]
MVKPKDRSTIKFDLKHETIAALKIEAALRQVDPRDVLEDLVKKNLADFVALAINSNKSINDKPKENNHGSAIN